MGRRKMLLATGLAVVTIVLLSAPTSAECPNGCSGNGACMAKDMCMCYKNYQGNDCLDRTCQFGYAHTDTPKGDINMDQLRVTPGWILADSQQDPAKTYEYFNPNAGTSEAHFYMECSNKGLVATMEKGTDNEWFTQNTGIIVTAVSSSDYVTLTVTQPGAIASESPTLFKLGQYVVVGKLTAVNTILLSYPIKHSLGSQTTRFDAVKAANNNGGIVVTELVLNAVVAAAATTVVVTTDPAPVAGDLFFFENQFYKYVSVVRSGLGTVPSPYLWTITLDRAFLGNSLNGGANTVLLIYKVTPPIPALQYNYVSECSGRGLCTTDTGVCACFKGYTNDNCDTQNILAL
ncbi:Tubular mastigoneme protein [Phytophthora megakarya]|uniref:Tubular mastigoneme protein n=1 Tax=Phytophthora megakarya TaxID=4795 RepID=A0A225X0X3_9STRA|nr:Tubular mastigoneme protein [Phytophthora megakarya]